VDLALNSVGSDMGELILGYPDVADVPYPPLLNEVQNYAGVQPYNVLAPALAEPATTYSVNQELPIELSWSPKGFARYYQVQISTNQDFATTLVSVAYQTDAFYVFNDAVGGTTYFYRVKTLNDGGSSSWSVGSFQTAPPAIVLQFPNGGEALQRGVSYFVRWTDNLSENVNISLYKSGVFLKSIATNVPGNGAAQWRLGFDLAAASDYSIQISSVTNAALTVSSAAAFSIVDAPSIISSSVFRLPDGRIQLSVAAPGAQQVSVLGSADFSTWQLLQSVPVVNGQAVFVDSAPSASSRFFRLRVP
jgi:Ser-Thr-rich glycosyl-phosphatidyl-inositol-anchored membrane family protein